MDPKVISEWVDEDIGPGSRGLIGESLYGHTVVPGDSEIDRLIAATERAYIDFDPNDEKFADLAQKVLGRIPTPEEWVTLIKSSSQSDQLKNVLLQSVTNIRSSPSPEVASKQGPAVIKMKRGTTINADMLKKSNSGPYYYVGIGEGQGDQSWGWRRNNRANKRANPEFFTRAGRKWQRMYRHILTLNAENVQSVRWLT